MDTVMSLVMLAALTLVAGAIWLWRKRGADKQVWLLLLLALVMIANVLIWPTSDGTIAVDRAAQGAR